MLSLGFEPTISAINQLQTYALDCTATGIINVLYCVKLLCLLMILLFSVITINIFCHAQQFVTFSEVLYRDQYLRSLTARITISDNL